MKSCTKCQWFDPFPPDGDGRTWLARCRAPRPACYGGGLINITGNRAMVVNLAEWCVFYAERSK
jgi:hypothetical protein